MPTVFIDTLGCAKNEVASRRIEKLLVDNNIDIQLDPVAADYIIVNTCGFIGPAKEESIETILSYCGYKQDSPEKKIIITGCLAQRYKNELIKNIPEVDYLLDFEETRNLLKIIGVPAQANFGFQAHNGLAAAYLQISDGCNQGCAFCAIPMISGRYRSRPIEDILSEAQYLTKNGCRELSIVGQDTGSYGSDVNKGINLAVLLRKLGNATPIQWMRIMYLQPRHLTDQLMSEIGENKKVCSYLDIPFQHGAPKILKSMKRWGNADKYLKKINEMRQQVPEIALRTSIIVGFPGETEKDIFLLADFLRQATFDYVGVFEFSAEEGTEAASYPGKVSLKEKRARACQVRELADEVSRQSRARFRDRQLDVLVESNDAVIRGRTEFQAPEVDGEVIIEKRANNRKAKVGDMLKVKITEIDEYDFTGVCVL